MWKRNFGALLCLVLVFAFVTRMYHLNLPDRYIFDEVYHAVTAKLIAKNDPGAYYWRTPAPEPDTAIDWLHPPLAKYTQALGISLFGETPFAWRLSSVLFGVGVIGLIALTALVYTRSHQLALFAAALASLDGLLLVQSRIAMNDIHVTFFILAAVAAYGWYRRTEASERLLLTGLLSGLALGSKWSGMFVILALGSWEAGRWLLHLKRDWGFPALKQFFLLTLSFVFIPVFVYLLSYSHMFLQGRTLSCSPAAIAAKQCYEVTLKWPPYCGDSLDHLNAHPVCNQLVRLVGIKPGEVFYKGYISHFAELHHQIWSYQTNLKATHGYQSRPWQWFLNLRPVWYYVDYGDESGKNLGNIYALGNTALFWIGDVAIIFTAFFLLWQLTSNHKEVSKYHTLALWLWVYCWVWLPWQLSPRIMFFYHYTPAVVFLSLILACWLYWLWKTEFGKKIVMLVFAIITGFFILWYPQWTGQLIPKTFANKVYFSIPSWR